MNRRMLSLIAVLTLTVLALPMVASAQESTREARRTLTLTEERINESFHVTNPVRRGISDVRVDLQPDQVSITYVVTRRAPQGSQTTTYNVNSVIVPSIQNGRLSWSVTSVTVDGQAASDDLIRQINASIESAWRNYVRRQLGTGHLSAITITDTEMTLTLE